MNMIATSRAALSTARQQAAGALASAEAEAPGPALEHLAEGVEADAEDHGPDQEVEHRRGWWAAGSSRRPAPRRSPTPASTVEWDR